MILASESSSQPPELVGMAGLHLEIPVESLVAWRLVVRTALTTRLEFRTQASDCMVGTENQTPHTVSSPRLTESYHPQRLIVEQWARFHCGDPLGPTGSESCAPQVSSECSAAEASRLELSAFHGILEESPVCCHRGTLAPFEKSKVMYAWLSTGTGSGDEKAAER